MVPEKQGLKLLPPHPQFQNFYSLSSGSRKTRIETVPFSPLQEVTKIGLSSGSRKTRIETVEVNTGTEASPGV